MPITMLSVSKIKLDPAFSARAERPSAELVRDIAEEMAGAEFPPIVADNTGSEIVVVDGWTRLAAAKLLGRSAIATALRVGSRREARLFCAASNAANGTRRSQA